MHFVVNVVGENYCETVNYFCNTWAISWVANGRCVWLLSFWTIPSSVITCTVKAFVGLVGELWSFL